MAVTLKSYRASIDPKGKTLAESAKLAAKMDKTEKPSIKNSLHEIV